MRVHMCAISVLRATFASVDVFQNGHRFLLDIPVGLHAHTYVPPAGQLFNASAQRSRHPWCGANLSPLADFFAYAFRKVPLHFSAKQYLKAC